jgi:hypothetical protein
LIEEIGFQKEKYPFLDADVFTFLHSQKCEAQEFSVNFFGGHCHNLILLSFQFFCC